MNGWATLRDLDQAAGMPKGTAFRAFKQLESSWREGADYRVLRPGRDDAELLALRGSRRLYAASRVGVLLSPGAATAVRDAMA